MYFSKWHSIEYFEENLGNVSQVQSLKRVLTLRDKTLASTKLKKTSRALKNSIFIFRLLAKIKLQRNQISWLRSQIMEQLGEATLLKGEVNSLKWESANLKAELALAKKSLSFFKEFKEGYEKES
ncbi:hypothetical protein LEP1GSC047_0233 [Leptospira inadai serovar Lyme str. 10]|uniref:Uncharacterized protein n=2 Tax=Leptospira inadai serovar Lyme TaxID=293084 RepID=V6H9D9_9LEPT|nr:hypothetical protein [Leptospira inadai]EQA35746.1 hypothetical protein LEP1GSC047_0233 [Leptospira inadai serovar Lyme str. 10]PNV76744.1 hypothetical protein BES34_000160 [Leptospira inadai serovar Lyme]